MCINNVDVMSFNHRHSKSMFEPTDHTPPLTPLIPLIPTPITTPMMLLLGI